jgi:hypothetical protein
VDFSSSWVLAAFFLVEGFFDEDFEAAFFGAVLDSRSPPSSVLPSPSLFASALAAAA